MEFFLPFDGPILTFIQQHFHNPVTDAFFPFVTYLGELGACWAFLSLVLLFMKKYRRAGILMLAAMLLGTLLGEGLLKHLICRPRPFQYISSDFLPLLISPPSGYSFPSGHTCASFAAASALFSQHRREGIFAFLLASLIGFSRMFLLVHFPSDVLAGALLGAFLGFGTAFLYQKWILPKFPRLESFGINS